MAGGICERTANTRAAATIKKTAADRQKMGRRTILRSRGAGLALVGTCRDGCLEQVACAADRLQMDRIFRIDLDLLPQSADINVHATRRNESFRAPHRI